MKGSNQVGRTGAKLEYKGRGKSLRVKLLLLLFELSVQYEHGMYDKFGVREYQYIK